MPPLGDVRRRYVRRNTRGARSPARAARAPAGKGERAGARSRGLGTEIAAGLGNLHRGHVLLICVL